jgi:hypothetical protein
MGKLGKIGKMGTEEKRLRLLRRASLRASACGLSSGVGPRALNEEQPRAGGGPRALSKEEGKEHL